MVLHSKYEQTGLHCSWSEVCRYFTHSGTFCNNVEVYGFTLSSYPYV